MNRKGGGILVRLIFGLLAGFVGFCAGMLFAGRFLVPAGSGLAGPAIAAGWALATAAILFLAALAFASRASGELFRRVFLVVVVTSALFAGWLAYRIVTQARESNARMATESVRVVS
jgi:hypothetical protein